MKDPKSIINFGFKIYISYIFMINMPAEKAQL